MAVRSAVIASPFSNKITWQVDYIYIYVYYTQLVSFQTKKIWENETCFHHLSEMWQLLHSCGHGLRTPREKIVFTARPKIHSHSQIFRYGRSIFFLPQRPNFSDIFDLCLHWVSVVHGAEYLSYVKFIATETPTFFGYIISVLASVVDLELLLLPY